MASALSALSHNSDLEGHAGAIFNNKGDAILPSPKLTASVIRELLAASENLASLAIAKERS